MVHNSETQRKPTIKQVEINTIATSFGGLAPRVASLHHYFISIDAYPVPTASQIHAEALPSNPSTEKLAAGLARAHFAYGDSQSTHPTCIVIITQDFERNVFDQKHVELSLIAQTKSKVFRLAFSQILKHTRLDDRRGLLFSPPAFPERTYEVTTVYFRAGYSP